MPNLIYRPGGEIGRRARFRCESRKVWGFESLPGHKKTVGVSPAVFFISCLYRHHFFFLHLEMFFNLRGEIIGDILNRLLGILCAVFR
jgi:hypothetical protein